jgi:hypothetical protein
MKVPRRQGARPCPEGPREEPAGLVPIEAGHSEGTGRSRRAASREEQPPSRGPDLLRDGRVVAPGGHALWLSTNASRVTIGSLCRSSRLLDVGRAAAFLLEQAAVERRVIPEERHRARPACRSGSRGAGRAMRSRVAATSTRPRRARPDRACMPSGLLGSVRVNPRQFVPCTPEVPPLGGSRTWIVSDRVCFLRNWSEVFLKYGSAIDS